MRPPDHADTDRIGIRQSIGKPIGHADAHAHSNPDTNTDCVRITIRKWIRVAQRQRHAMPQPNRGSHRYHGAQRHAEQVPIKTSFP